VLEITDTDLELLDDAFAAARALSRQIRQRQTLQRQTGPPETGDTWFGDLLAGLLDATFSS
jgi:hypothetical protein